MDERQAQLIAAAEAVRAWVHAQRATWPVPSGSVAPSAPHRAVPALVFAGPTPIVASLAPAMDGIVTTLAPTVSRRLAIGPALGRVRAGTAASAARIGQMAGAALPLVRRSWRVALAATLIVASVGTVRVHWTTLTTTVRTELTRRLAIAGQRATALPPAEISAAPGATAAAREGVRGDRGGLRIESDPPGAQVTIDGRVRGVTPLTVADLPVGSHEVELRTDAGSVHRTVAISSARTTQLTEAIYSGWVHVSSPIELQLSEGTRAIRLDDRNQALLSPGSHDVVIQNRALGFREVRHVDVRPGDTTLIVVNPSPSPLSVTASEPARVAIDGALVGDTPLADYPAKIGTREITVTSASGVVRRMTLTITVQPSRVDVDFSKPPPRTSSYER